MIQLGAGARLTSRLVKPHWGGDRARFIWSLSKFKGMRESNIENTDWGKTGAPLGGRVK